MERLGVLGFREGRLRKRDGRGMRLRGLGRGVRDAVFGLVLGVWRVESVSALGYGVAVRLGRRSLI